MAEAHAWVDLNADLGEITGEQGRELDAALLGLITSANVACGGHAGDAATMRHAAEIAATRGVSIGAQVSYPDRENFGRRQVDLPAAALRESIATQVADLAVACAAAGIGVSYIRPHGALYHAANASPEIAELVVSAALDGLGGPSTPSRIWVLSSPGTQVIAAGRSAGLSVASEVFIDRGYHAEGVLLPRGHPQDLLIKHTHLRERVDGFLLEQTLESADGVRLRPEQFGAGHGPAPRSMCLHSDSPNAPSTARMVRERAAQLGIALRSFSGSATDIDAPSGEPHG